MKLTSVGWESEESECVLNFFPRYVIDAGQVFTGMTNGIHAAIRSDQFDKFLLAQMKFKGRFDFPEFAFVIVNPRQGRLSLLLGQSQFNITGD